MAMNSSEFKQVIVIRTDLEMSKGKTTVQAGHAAVSASEEARKRNPRWWRCWIEEGQCKVTVEVPNEEKLVELMERAKKLHLSYALITDRGLTELPPGTTTCLGVGPAPKELVDKVTGSLPLL